MMKGLTKVYDFLRLDKQRHVESSSGIERHCATHQLGHPGDARFFEQCDHDRNGYPDLEPPDNNDDGDDSASGDGDDEGNGPAYQTRYSADFWKEICAQAAAVWRSRVIFSHDPIFRIGRMTQMLQWKGTPKIRNVNITRPKTNALSNLLMWCI